MKLYRKMCRPMYDDTMFSHHGYIGSKEPLDDWYPEEEEPRLKEKYEPMYDWNKVWAKLTFEYKYVEWEGQEMEEELNFIQPKKIVGKLISTDVFDKIKDEIEEYKSRQLTLAIGVDDLEKGKQIALEYVLEIIDKYKRESEE